MYLRNLVVLIAVTASAQTIDAVRVVSKTVERKVSLPGEIVPYEQVSIYAKVTGFVDRVLADRGSRVRKGQLLATVTAPEMKAQQAEAAAKVVTAQSDLAAAKARATAARATYERLLSASKTVGAIAGNELLQAEQMAIAEESRAQAASAGVKAEEAAQKMVEETEAYLQITAPFSGMITERLASPGALANQQVPLFQLEQTSRLRVVVAVPELYAGSIAEHAKVNFKVPAYAGETFTGTVARVAHSVDPKTRSMAVELDVTNGGDRLAPGMYPTVDWPLRPAKSALLVPPSSIVTTTERTFVDRVRDGVVSWVPVSRGAPLGDLVEVSGALAAGDVLVLRGTDELREGAKIGIKIK